MSVKAYYDRFINLVNVIEHIEGTIGTESGIIKDIACTKGNKSNDLSWEDKHEAKELCLSVSFTCGADRGGFSKLLDKIKNYYLEGYEGYPQLLRAAYNLLTNWKQKYSGSILNRMFYLDHCVRKT
jgi:hypothetical protein